MHERLHRVRENHALRRSAPMPPDAPRAACDETGQQLYRLNAEAVAQRYGRREDVPAYRSSAAFPPLVQQLKSLNFLIFKCSEGKVTQTALYQSLVRRKIALTQSVRVLFVQFPTVETVP
ncbi:MAG: hypothetical protein ACJ8FY_19675 [Gemmataceae bacterium]